MNLQTVGGVAGLTCAATYLFGFALLVTVLAPLGFGTIDIDARGVVDFIKNDGSSVPPVGVIPAGSAG